MDSLVGAASRDSSGSRGGGGGDHGAKRRKGCVRRGEDRPGRYIHIPKPLLTFLLLLTNTNFRSCRCFWTFDLFPTSKSVYYVILYL